MSLKNPSHPGRIIRHECMTPLGLSVTAAARALGVERQTLNNLVNEKSGISTEMAIRLEKGFGSSAEMWYGLQMEYDLPQAEKHADKIKVERIRQKQLTC